MRWQIIINTSTGGSEIEPYTDAKVGEDDIEFFKENGLKNLGTDFFSFEEEIS